MEISPISVLKPNVTSQQALQTFLGRGLFSLLWTMRRGTLQRLADAYVPFWLYRVEYEMARAPQVRWFALDAVDGSLDLFTFPHLPVPAQFVSVSTRNHLRPALTSSAAETLLRDKVLCIIFQQGFFKLRHSTLEIVRESTQFYVPYWLGFYGESGPVRCRVMDAVRRRVEGAKASAFFEEWLAA